MFIFRKYDKILVDLGSSSRTGMFKLGWNREQSQVTRLQLCSFTNLFIICLQHKT
ncbi:hypothetical protein Hanom_Chr06g00553931 [Helianthus anomalus]